MKTLAFCTILTVLLLTRCPPTRADWFLDFEEITEVPESLRIQEYLGQSGGESSTFEPIVQDGALHLRDTRSPQNGGALGAIAWVDQPYSDVHVSAVLNPDGASRHWAAVYARCDGKEVWDGEGPNKYGALTFFGEGQYKGILWVGKMVPDPGGIGFKWEHSLYSNSLDRLPDVTQPATLELDVTDVLNDQGERTHVEVVGRLFDHNDELVSSLSFQDNGSFGSPPFDAGLVQYIPSVWGDQRHLPLYGSLDMISVTGTVVSDGSGDYNRNGQLDAGDLDLQAIAIAAGEHPPEYDLTGDQLVTSADRHFWINELKQTWFGDADLNGEFNSSDMVQVFTAGKYETGQAAGWAQGDWDGNGLFESGDMVKAFTDGGYERGLRTDAVAVPEPGAWVLLVLGLTLWLFSRPSRAFNLRR